MEDGKGKMNDLLPPFPLPPADCCCSFIPRSSFSPVPFLSSLLPPLPHLTPLKMPLLIEAPHTDEAQDHAASQGNGQTQVRLVTDEGNI
jgi:hypothetical protein